MYPGIHATPGTFRLSTPSGMQIAETPHSLIGITDPMSARAAEAYPITAEQEAARARAEADEKGLRAQELAQAAAKIVKEAEEAKAAAQAAVAEAEAKARVAHYATGSGLVTTNDESAATEFCAKLGSSVADMREVVTLKKERALLGETDARGLAHLFTGRSLGKLEVLACAGWSRPLSIRVSLPCTMNTFSCLAPANPELIRSKLFFAGCRATHLATWARRSWQIPSTLAPRCVSSTSRATRFVRWARLPSPVR